MLEAGAAYLRIVGPAYGFFGLGLCLYFASQGAGKLWWPLLAGSLRLVIAVGGAWVALQVTGSLDWVFAALAVALVVYGIGLTAAVASGAWFRTAGRSPKTRADRRRASISVGVAHGRPAGTPAWARPAVVRLAADLGDRASRRASAAPGARDRPGGAVARPGTHSMRNRT